MSDDPEQDMDELAAELAVDAAESFESNKRDQHELLDAVAEKDGAPLLETKCNIHGHTVPVSARFTGDLIDKFGRLDEQVERIEKGDARAYEVSEVADEITQLTADAVDDPEITKKGLYRLYRGEGMDALKKIFDKVYESLEKEEKRKRGDADGFREN